MNQALAILATMKSLYALDLTYPERQNVFFDPVYFPSSSTYNI
tara:strand:+ start:369 stop:497 length:129 start_codon:yes stop_codon:yes gene_type:complete